jgi:hypothetical protein
MIGKKTLLRVAIAALLALAIHIPARAALVGYWAGNGSALDSA